MRHAVLHSQATRIELWEHARVHSQVVAAVEGLARDGFVSYFGLQRFGSGMSATHK